MTRILKKIANPQEDTMKINQNFDTISQELADRSGAFSNVASISVTVSDGTTHTVEVSVIDSLNIYSINKLPVIPRVLMYVGTDGDGTYLYPAGGNLTDAQSHGLELEVFVSRIVINQATDEKATYYIRVRNTSGDDQTIYLTTDVYYVPAPELGIARREE